MIRCSIGALMDWKRVPFRLQGGSLGLFIKVLGGVDKALALRVRQGFAGTL